jgi:hypothetical protein
MSGWGWIAAAGWAVNLLEWVMWVLVPAPLQDPQSHPDPLDSLSQESANAGMTMTVNRKAVSGQPGQQS